MVVIEAKVVSELTTESEFSQLLDDYKLSLETANRSPKTISWYLDILTRYSAFLRSGGLVKPAHELGKEELRAYIAHLQSSNRWAGRPNIKSAQGKLSPHSIQGHVRAIKAFFSWLFDEGHIEENPLARYPPPKAPQKQIPTLTLDQLRKLLTLIDNSEPVGARNRVMLLLLLDTGMRVSELVGIKLDDLDLVRSLVKILGKGQKERTVPFCSKTRKELRRYIKNFRPSLAQEASPYLFPKSDGSRVSVNCVQQFLRRLASRAGLQGVKCSPHIFRHTFATMSVADGANPFILKDILGHSSLLTTQKYLHLQPSDLRAQHAKFSPIAKLINGSHAV
jgi:site-specific recombinase XerD